MISSKGGNSARIEKVSGVELVIAHKLKYGTAQFISARLRDHAHVRSRAFAVFRRVGVGQHIELPDGFDAQQLPADTARSNPNAVAARVLDAVQQEEILQRPAPGHGEIVPSSACGRLTLERRIVDGSRVESDQVIEAAPVQRQILNLLFPNQP